MLFSFGFMKLVNTVASLILWSKDNQQISI